MGCVTRHSYIKIQIFIVNYRCTVKTSQRIYYFSILRICVIIK